MPRLMIVDDELDVREYLKNFFKRRKVDVVTAESGEEALKLLASQEPDLMLLDIRLTGMNGIETLQKVRQSGSRVKVIMVTGVEDKTLLDSMAELDVLSCIHKPLILEELEKEVFQRLVSK